MEYPNMIKNIQNPNVENPLGVNPVSIDGKGDAAVSPADAMEVKNDDEMTSELKSYSKKENQRRHERKREHKRRIVDQKDENDDDNSRKRGYKLLEEKIQRDNDQVQQLLDMVPRTKEELFSYKIKWDVCDKYELHEIMRPWISIKLRTYMEEQPHQDFVVDWIGSSIKNHESALKILNWLQPMFDDEAEMFFLSLWKMFIFEIKKAERAEKISNVKPKETSSAVERPISMQSGDRVIEQGQHLNDMESTNCAKDVNKETTFDNGSLNLHKPFDVKKFWKEEPFPDFVPKTKEELLAYDINWDLSDKHELHKKMRPWISLKVMDAREKEAAISLDEIVATIKNHVCASEMVELLYPIFEEVTEMFVGNMLVMLIFQIMKVETELDNGERPEAERTRNMHSLGRLPVQWEVIQTFRNMVMSFDSEQRYNARRIINTRPKTREQVFSYEINWDFYWKCGIHENTEELLLELIPQFLNGKKEVLQVYNLTTSSIVKRVSASLLVELLRPSLGDKSAVFVYRLWSSIILWHNLELGNA